MISSASFGRLLRPILSGDTAVASRVVLPALGRNVANRLHPAATLSPAASCTNSAGDVAAAATTTITTTTRFFSSVSQAPTSSSSSSSPVVHDYGDEKAGEVDIDDDVADFSGMTNEELQDTDTIPGWDLIHSPPRKLPRGALVGTVVSTKMMKTVNVAVDRWKIVPKIRKRVRFTRKFMAHDEKEVANAGDLVMITPCHKISKNKHFVLREIVRPKGVL